MATLYTTYLTATAALTFQKPTDSVRVATYLGSQPRGNVWAPPEMSNLIPAYSGQFVYAGHWFMTPEMREKRQQYDNFVQSAALAGEIGKSLLVVGSTGGRNTLREHFSGGLIHQGLSWPLIELAGNGAELGLAMEG